MELLFIWIEKFRNLEKAGLNFSNDHDIIFNEKDNQLRILETPFSIENFFGKNVSNITGIIGRNATGKSNILDLVCFLTKGGSSYINEKYIILYGTKDKKDQFSYQCYSNFLIKENTACNIESIKFYNGISPNWSVIFLSNVNDGKKQQFPKEVIDLSQNSNRRFYPFSVRDRGRKSDVFYQFKFILSEYFQNVELEIPKRIVLSPRYDVQRNISSSRTPKVLEGLTRNLRKQLRFLDNSDHFRYSYVSSILYFLSNDLYAKSHSRYKETESLNLNKQEQNFDEFEDLISREFDVQRQIGIHDFIYQSLDLISNYFRNYELSDSKSVVNLDPLLSFIFKVDEVKPTLTKEFGFKNSYRTNYEIELTEANSYILKSHFQDFDLDEIFDVDWGGISSGHKAFINLFAQFHSAIRRVSHHDNVLVCIDEGDLYLHPQWQKEFLNRIIKFVPTIIRKNLQFILTTHSPFLVSDLPKENLVLLDRDENGKSILISNTDYLSKTFGANLNDLLVESFFLKEGVISEFALSKIKEAIAIANNKNSTITQLNYASRISNLIGDDLISVKLKKMISDVEDNKQ